MATVGIFVLLLGVCLFFCRPILLPVTAALVIGTTLAPIVKGAARHRISPWATAVVLGAALLAAAGAAVTLLAQPVSEWIAKAPDIGATIKQKLYVLDRPLAALHELQEVLLPSAGNAVGRAIAVGARHPGGCFRHAGGGADHPVLRHVDLLSRHANGFSQIHGVVLHQPRCQAPRPAHQQRHRGSPCVLRR